MTNEEFKYLKKLKKKFKKFAHITTMPLTDFLSLDDNS